MRSKLFVPGSRPELFTKALRSPADALSFDLEDAVAAERKDAAREAVGAFLAGPGAAAHGKICIVRVNPIDSGLFEADLDAIVVAGLDTVNLPKVESADEVRAAAAAIARRARGAKGKPGILANIETPRGLRHAAEIAAADARVVGLQVGFGDLFEPLGIDRTLQAALDHVRLLVRLAAGEAGLAAYDGAFVGVGDSEAFRAECETARRLGFAGKSCIHPSQVPIANAVFRPSPEAVAWARRVMEAAEAAKAQGIGAFMVEGRMVDGPFIESARALLADAARHGREAGR
jgi:citrate lyase subunit beta/citryl-CoA lyase